MRIVPAHPKAPTCTGKLNTHNAKRAIHSLNGTLAAIFVFEPLFRAAAEIDYCYYCCVAVLSFEGQCGELLWCRTMRTCVKYPCRFKVVI